MAQRIGHGGQTVVMGRGVLAGGPYGTRVVLMQVVAKRQRHLEGRGELERSIAAMRHKARIATGAK